MASFPVVNTASLNLVLGCNNVHNIGEVSVDKRIVLCHPGKKGGCVVSGRTGKVDISLLIAQMLVSSSHLNGRHIGA